MSSNRSIEPTGAGKPASVGSCQTISGVRTPLGFGSAKSEMESGGAQPTGGRVPFGRTRLADLSSSFRKRGFMRTRVLSLLLLFIGFANSSAAQYPEPTSLKGSKSVFLKKTSTQTAIFNVVFNSKPLKNERCKTKGSRHRGIE